MNGNQPNEFGTLISQKITSESDTFYHHYDALGSTAALTDSSEVVTDEYAFEAFGETAAESGPTPNPYQWVAQVGYRKDEETSLYDLRRRNYDPKTGRFSSEDPVRSDEENLYRYVGNNSVGESDPSGLQKPVYLGGDFISESSVPHDVLRQMRENAEQHPENARSAYGQGSYRIVGGFYNPLSYRGNDSKIVVPQNVEGVPISTPDSLMTPELWPYSTDEPLQGLTGSQVHSLIKRDKIEIFGKLGETKSYVWRTHGKKIVFIQHENQYIPVGEGPETLNSDALADIFVHDPEEIRRKRMLEGTLTFALYAVPFGAAIDQFEQHGIYSGEAWLSLAGDVAGILTLGGSKLATVGGKFAPQLQRVGRGTQMTGIGLEISVGTARATQAVGDVADEDYVQAAGHSAETVLRVWMAYTGLKGLTPKSQLDEFLGPPPTITDNGTSIKNAISESAEIGENVVQRSMVLRSGEDAASINLSSTSQTRISTTVDELFRSEVMPGQTGIILDQRTVYFSDLHRLAVRDGVEYVLTKENGAFILRSGLPKSVSVPMGVRPIAHTHQPDIFGFVDPLPSRSDINALNQVWDIKPTGPRPASQVIWGSNTGDTTIFRATGLDIIPKPKVRNP